MLKKGGKMNKIHLFRFFIFLFLWAFDNKCVLLPRNVYHRQDILMHS